MVAAHRDLASELNIVISHMTEQSSHNKVNIGTYKIALNNIVRILLMVSSVMSKLA